PSRASVCVPYFFRVLFFFFFQAEDGIRDFHVTGVQTCALPISWRRRVPSPRASAGCCSSQATPGVARPPSGPQNARARVLRSLRSEERRVGKECRARGEADE